MTIYPVHGGCICGNVRYSVSGPANCVVHCHCSMCRHSYASLVGTGATIKTDQVKIDKGKANLAIYEGPPGVRRHFCQTCGCSILYFDASLPELVFYYPATLDGGAHPGHPDGAEHHVYVGSKADWEAFEDDLPRHPEDIGNLLY